MKEPSADLKLLRTLNLIDSAKITSKNLLETLDWIRDAWEGRRAQLYGLMAKAWVIVLLLRGDTKLQKKFMLRAKITASNKEKIVTEVMAYITRAKTESARKMAWKYGRVLEFLHDRGIKSGKMAAEISDRGGIEEIYDQAAELTPRRESKSSKTETRDKKSMVQVGKKGANIKRKSPAPNHNDRPSDRSRTNDQYVTMQVLIKMSDRDAIAEIPKDSRGRLTFKKVDQHGAQIKVIRLKKLAETTSDDW
jgi:hypothetical protein